MGAIRTISIILVTLIIIPALLLSNLFLNFDLSYNPENIAENAKPLVKQNTQDSEVSVNEGLQRQCSQTEREIISLPLGQVPCSKIEKSENEFQTTIKHIYEKDHDCDFMNCYTNIDDPSIMVSEKTDKNLSKMFWILAGIALFFLLLAFLSFKRSSSFMLYTGIILMLFSPTSLIIKGLVSSLSPSNISTGVSGIMKNAIGILFNNALTTTLIWAILGIALITASISIRKKRRR